MKGSANVGASDRVRGKRASDVLFAWAHMVSPPRQTLLAPQLLLLHQDRARAVRDAEAIAEERTALQREKAELMGARVWGGRGRYAWHVCRAAARPPPREQPRKETDSLNYPNTNLPLPH